MPCGVDSPRYRCDLSNIVNGGVLMPFLCEPRRRAVSGRVAQVSVTVAESVYRTCMLGSKGGGGVGWRPSSNYSPRARLSPFD
jgi:hypothetical protein